MMTILLIDDDRVTMEPLYDLLAYDFDVHWIQDAVAVDQEVKTKKYDAIILDIMMPPPNDWDPEDKTNSDDGMSTGKILFKRIRSFAPNIPVLIYSARDCDFLDEHSTYLSKPDFAATIIDTIKELIK